MSIAKIVASMCVVAITAPASASEVIGDWLLTGVPSTASLVQGGGEFFDWLNEEDTPIDINDAFTNFPITQSGYGNALAGTILEMTFGPGVVNLGNGVADLVFLEARFVPDAGLYGVTVDGYAPTLFLGFGDAGFEDSGVDRSYFYGFNGQQATADIFGAEIDLSYFGIGVGTIETPLTMRFEVLTDFRAPIGVGALVVVPAPGPLAVLAMGAAVAASGRRRRRLRE